MLEWGIHVIHFQHDRFLLTLLLLLCVAGALLYPVFRDSKRAKRFFGIVLLLSLLGIGGTAALYLWRLPRGLSAQYYPNPAFQTDPSVKFTRYFDVGKPGQRIDRFIDFKPNDFQAYQFSKKKQSFSARWQGFVYLPENTRTPTLLTNGAASLFLDDALVENPPSEIDFGAPEGRRSLGEGWSYDEVGKNEDGTERSYVWSSWKYSDFYLGVDEIADYQLSFHGLQYEYPNSPAQQVTVAVNGAVLDTVMLRKGWRWDTYSVSVPRQVVQESVPGTVWVRLTYSNPVRPSELTQNSSDQRLIAVAIDRVSFEKKGAVLNAQDAEEKVAQRTLPSEGLQKIAMSARGRGADPTLALAWGAAGRSELSIVPEDVLFPATLTKERILEKWRSERIFLIVVFFSKIILIAAWLSVLLVYAVLPYAPTLFTREAAIVFGICALAFGIRMFFLLERTMLDPHPWAVQAGTDQSAYVFFARGLLRGYWPGLSHEPFYFNVLPPFYYLGCFMLFGESLFMVRATTVVLSSCSILFVYLIGRRLFNRPVALLAAVGCACNGVLIFYETSLLVAPLKTFLSLLALWLLLENGEKLSWRKTIILGIVLGLSAFARGTLMLFMPFVMLWMFAMPSKEAIHRRILHFGVVCMMMGLTIAPVTIRNYYSNEQHPFTLITSQNLSRSLWFGNNPSSSGSRHWSQEVHTETRQRMKKTGSSYVDEVLRYIQTQPLDYLRLELRKLRLFWRGYEIGNLLPYYFYRERSSILSLPWINFVLLGPLSIVGLFLAARTWKRAFIVYSFIAMHFGFNLLVYTLARYRVPIIPLLSIFAAYTVYMTLQYLRQKKWYRFIAVLVVFVSLYLGLNYSDAARHYQARYRKPMPMTRIVRYWELFFNQ